RFFFGLHRGVFCIGPLPCLPYQPVSPSSRSITKGGIGKQKIAKPLVWGRGRWHGKGGDAGVVADRHSSKLSRKPIFDPRTRPALCGLRSQLGTNSIQRVPNGCQTPFCLSVTPQPRPPPTA